MENGVLKHLDEHGIVWHTEDNLQAAFQAADVVYWTRVQKERLKDSDRYIALRDQFHIGLEQMGWLPPHAIVMHPMPIDEEISPEVDDHPQAAYFEQAANGPFIRAALLLHIFGYSREGIPEA